MPIFRIGIIAVSLIMFQNLSFAQVGEIKKEVRDDKKKRDKKKKYTAQSTIPSSSTLSDNDDNSQSENSKPSLWNLIFPPSQKEKVQSQIDTTRLQYYYSDTIVSQSTSQAYDPFTDKDILNELDSTSMIKFPDWSTFAEFGYTRSWGIRNSSMIGMGRMEMGLKVISSEIRYQRLADNTGELDLFDWQIVRLNLYGGDFRFAFGLGLVSVVDMSISYFDWSFTLDGYLVDNILRLKAEYRNATRVNQPSFRREVSIELDYDLSPKKKVHWCPTAGLRYQNFFGEYDQVYFDVGLLLRLY